MGRERERENSCSWLTCLSPLSQVFCNRGREWSQLQWVWAEHHGDPVCGEPDPHWPRPGSVWGGAVSCVPVHIHATGQRSAETVLWWDEDHRGNQI